MENLDDRRHRQNKHTAHGVMAGIFLGSVVTMGTALLLSMRWLRGAGIGRKSLELQGQMVETVQDAVDRVQGKLCRTTTSPDKPNQQMNQHDPHMVSGQADAM